MLGKEQPTHQHEHSTDGFVSFFFIDACIKSSQFTIETKKTGDMFKIFKAPMFQNVQYVSWTHNSSPEVHEIESRKPLTVVTKLTISPFQGKS